jgi:hypothetical protein
MGFSKLASAVDSLLHSASVLSLSSTIFFSYTQLFILRRLPTGVLGFKLALWKH